jgi:hypothetical protein
MPAKMTMSLTNNNFNRVQMAAFFRARQAVPKQQPSRLNSSMVERIHAIKPGCGSCGK